MKPLFALAMYFAFTCGALLAQSQSGAPADPTKAGADIHSVHNQAASPSQTPSPNPGSAAPVPHSKAQPQAKSQAEFSAYQAVAAKPDPLAMEVVAADFQKKYPDSELLVALYSGVMQKYQNINNADKVLEMGHKILQLEPENVPALALTSYVLSESTRETDLDRNQKYDEGLKSAQKVITTIDTALVVPPTVTPEQLAGVKSFLISMADSAMGYIELSQKNYVASEQHFKAAIDASKGSDGDPITYLRLAIAQDNQKKYSDAMANADKAVQLAQTQHNDQVVNMGKNEKDRLSKLTANSIPLKQPAPKQ